MFVSPKTSRYIQTIFKVSMKNTLVGGGGGGVSI